jgi:coenzyme F420 hydrogenase subunit beta
LVANVVVNYRFLHQSLFLPTPFSLVGGLKLYLHKQLANYSRSGRILMAQNQNDNYHTHKTKDEAQIERQFLSGTKDSDVGIYCNLFSLKTGFKGQDGGVVTGLLAKGFEEGIFDAAIVVRRMESYSAQAVVAQNAAEAAAAMGTKYLRVNVTTKLRELISQGKKRIAVVCTPCEGKAVRKIQQTLKGDVEITVIGLFCYEAFNREKLKQELGTRLGVDIDQAQKTQVRQGRFIISIEGKEYSCRVKDLDSAAEKACSICDDFTSQFADVSVGSVGSKPGYSTVIVRSEKGEKLVRKLKAVEETVEKIEVTRIAKFKRERAEKTLTTLNKAS